MTPPALLDAGAVRLRRARLDDADALFAAYAGDPAATRYLSWPARRSVAEVEEWLAPRVARWETGEELRWVIVEEPDGPAFGTVSLRQTELGLDLGYGLAMARSGNGIATSVLQRLIGWLEQQPSPIVVTAATDPENVASTRVLRKCDFRLARRERSAWRHHTGEIRDSLIFQRLCGR